MKMLGKMDQPPCGSHCCGVPSKDKANKRRIKRREKREWKNNVGR